MRRNLFYCKLRLTMPYVWFVLTAEHLSNLFITCWLAVTVLFQLYCVCATFQLYFSRILAVLFAYHDNLAEPNITPNIFPAIWNFKKFGLGPNITEKIISVICYRYWHNTTIRLHKNFKAWALYSGKFLFTYLNVMKVQIVRHKFSY